MGIEWIASEVRNQLVHLGLILMPCIALHVALSSAPKAGGSLWGLLMISAAALHSQVGSRPVLQCALLHVLSAA